ncbi:hypothetical protein CLPUN_39140 [Clostridium puniceum]|uniref:Uncharacterized protein n=1 Tax=Clostridium puniceum TaxID=29367 RepID=A0A1S8TA40_9CLOT|nr:hypothetical protein [Clostridium puniceum]OOM74461.1 hypothetical protein CLPUN_39140 [Clostridium puniceum]
MYVSMMALFVIVIIFLCVGIIEPSNVIWWGEYEKKTRKRVLGYYGVASLALLLILVFTHDMSINSAKEEVQARKVVEEQKQASNIGYKPTTEEKKVLDKHYEDFTSDEFDMFEKLEDTYDSFNDEGKTAIKSDIERIRNERTKFIEENKKQIEENNKTYADFMKEIESSYQSMKVKDISGKDKTKQMNINMTLLNNLDDTYYECAKLTLDNETRMKEIGINKIIIFVNDKNGENQGILSFELQSGKYKSKLNTFSR